MKSTLRMSVALCAVFLAALATPSLAQETPTGCVDVELGVSPNPVCLGSPATILASIENCGPSRDKVFLTIAVSGPGLTRTFDAVSKLPAGFTKQVERQVTLPSGLVSGTYAIAVTATTRHGGSDTAVTTFDLSSACGG